MRNLSFSTLNLILLVLLCGSSLQGLDLKDVRVERLANGLTVLVLEDHTQPLVSTQMLYRVGGRNECVGSTGLAHFVEHMAFRATKNFPGNDVVGRIYAVGGEWHGYTWIDQTTYFETVPLADLDLVLQIQSDRMNNVLNRSEEVEVERGAVLTELHGYENDPASVLNDAVIAASFQQHPYRYNVIGWTSDVEKITHTDILNFYQRFYAPANAVLAISGDVNTADVIARVRKYFERIPSGLAAAPLRTVEPPQAGERRITLQGSGPYNYYQISYRAPAAKDPDYPAFLLLQSVLTGSGGVNFRQRGSGEFARPGTRFFDLKSRVATNFYPTADPYVFTLTGRTNPAVSPVQTEQEIEKKLAALREIAVDQAELERAQKQIAAELVFDIETTEDAAHQLAFFEGIGAFSALQRLPDLLQSVTPEVLKQTARKYFQPHQRTIGWYLTQTAAQNVAASDFIPLTTPMHAKEAPSRRTLKPPVTKTLKNGLTIIIQNIDRTPTGFLRVLYPSNLLKSDLAEYSQDFPVWGHTSLEWRFLKQDLQATIAEAKKIVAAGIKNASADPGSLDDPEFRLQQTLQASLGIASRKEPPKPVLIAVVGDVDEQTAVQLLEEAFSGTEAGKPRKYEPIRIVHQEQTVHMPGKAQSQFGYALVAPPPSQPESYAYRLLLYTMTHIYEGRLGEDLIGKRGLIYSISSRYNSDGDRAWISISTGVNPNQLQPLRSRFMEIMNDLKQNPPTEAELAEAKEHLIGRRLTAYQSNEELSGFYCQEWVEQGRLLALDEFERKVRAITLKQVHSIIPSFLNGASVTVDTTS